MPDYLNVFPAYPYVLLFSEKSETAGSAPDYDCAQPSVAGVDFNVGNKTYPATAFGVYHLFVPQLRD